MSTAKKAVRQYRDFSNQLRYIETHIEEVEKVGGYENLIPQLEARVAALNAEVAAAERRIVDCDATCVSRLADADAACAAKLAGTDKEVERRLAEVDQTNKQAQAALEKTRAKQEEARQKAVELLKNAGDKAAAIEAETQAKCAAAVVQAEASVAEFAAKRAELDRIIADIAAGEKKLADVKEELARVVRSHLAV